MNSEEKKVAEPGKRRKELFIYEMGTIFLKWEPIQKNGNRIFKIGSQWELFFKNLWNHWWLPISFF